VTTYDLEILIRTKKVGDDPSPPPNAGLKWTELASKLSIAKQAFATVAAGAKVAYDVLKQGAELEAARGRFDNLTATINTTGDALLVKLKEATKGMVSDAELIAGASDIISLGLAKNEGDTVRLATAVSTLGLDMQQVILTFANNSKARLDSLGLSVEGVTQKAAELEAQGFTGDAFDEAVLSGLEEKMQLLGDASLTTAGQLQILESEWANLVNTAKQGAAEIAGPVVSALTSDIQSQKQLTAAYQQGIITWKEWRELSVQSRREGGLNAETNKEYAAVVEELTGLLAKQSGEMAKVNQAAVEAAAADAVLLTNVNALVEAEERRIAGIIEYSAAAAAAAGANENLADKQAQMTSQTGAAEQAVIAANLANKAYFDGIEQGRQALSAAFEASAEPVNELLSAQADLAAAEGEWVTRTVSTAGQVGAINAQLASDLSDDQAKAYREILRTVDEGSAEWLSAYNALQNDLTQSQRDALVAQQADLANQPDRLIDVYTGDSAAAEEAQARITAANEAIKQSYRETAAEALLAQTGVTQATLDTLVAIGYMTQEQADARLEFANTTTAIEQLAASSEYARLTADEQAAALNALIDGTAQTADQAINLATQQTAVNDALAAMPKAVVSTVTIRGLDDADTRIGDIMRQLDALDGRSVSANVTVNTGEIPELGSGGGGKEAPKKAYGGPVSAGKLYRVGEGNRPELFMIPGDDGRVFSNAQSQALMGGQTINDNRQTIINANTKEAAALALASAQVSKRTRFNRSMGV
jgi:hypothetical protein